MVSAASYKEQFEWYKNRDNKSVSNIYTDIYSQKDF